MKDIWYKVKQNDKDKLVGKVDEFITKLIEENKKLKDTLKEYSKDEEIVKLKERLSEINSKSLYIMNDKENQEASAFSTKHYNSCKGGIDYILTGTGLGPSIAVQCKKCKEKEFITDVSNW